ncbi:hypothetical protein OESDEN_03360 [Oesophagostomum dentatum]|uniref:C-type lectin domain-containing protein n=1 Tax=Oesophagostomum dentatum TaxID=61180 RepID=A0A0B1TLK3_OESDE|nr:hypothetical protein OESDEN_03360 [Oesophagostomum dentatum]
MRSDTLANWVWEDGQKATQLRWHPHIGRVGENNFPYGVCGVIACRFSYMRCKYWDDWWCDRYRAYICERDNCTGLPQ